MAQAGTIGSGIDERLLAGELTQQKQAAKQGEIQEQAQEADLRQRQRHARQAEAEKQAKEEEAAEEEAENSIKKATKWLLRQAWLSGATVFGFIFLGLPYLNFHVFGQGVLGDKIFCKFGEEWEPEAIKEVAGEFGESGSKIIGMIEIMAVIMLDVVVVLCLATVVIIIYLITSPTEALKIFGAGLVYDIVKDFF